jgi:NADPH:quinone reductase-like Zn-dependent oxidoreductase
VKAIVQDRYGGLEVLEFRDIDRPVPKDDQVLVRVHAAGSTGVSGMSWPASRT